MTTTITLHTAAQDRGPFNSRPAGTWELDAENILANDIVLPWEEGPGTSRLYVIGNEYGPCGAVWAANEPEALDELCDAGLSDGMAVEEPEDGNPDDDGITRLGNAGDPHDLQHAWLAEVVFDLARDARLLALFAEARGAGYKDLRHLA